MQLHLAGAVRLQVAVFVREAMKGLPRLRLRQHHDSRHSSNSRRQENGGCEPWPAL
ncbi:hypothetical protein [Paenibacillus helianthi]|uniref:hypothetical protein n=1 Tax=Paenibacillus helianthi TaxID=1349432 RepID=UPI001FC8EC09|nr:hypothetical protein [Paenibacillus helianthi]